MPAKRRKRLILFIVGTPILLASLCFVTILLLRNPNQYPDFTQFATAADMKSFLESKLVVGTTTKASMQNFLESEGLSRCYDEENIANIRSVHNVADDVISCWVLAPNDFGANADWLQKFIVSSLMPQRYSIDFWLKTNQLIDITVRKLGPVLP